MNLGKQLEKLFPKYLIFEGAKYFHVCVQQPGRPVYIARYTKEQAKSLIFSLENLRNINLRVIV
jgi:hypothetical protein